jgi:hypothetical protein
MFLANSICSDNKRPLMTKKESLKFELLARRGKFETYQ